MYMFNCVEVKNLRHFKDDHVLTIDATFQSILNLFVDPTVDQNLSNIVPHFSFILFVTGDLKINNSSHFRHSFFSRTDYTSTRGRAWPPSSIPLSQLRTALQSP